MHINNYYNELMLPGLLPAGLCDLVLAKCHTGMVPPLGSYAFLSTE